MLAAAEAADVQEDEIFGKDKRGDEIPPGKPAFQPYWGKTHRTE
jgi:hypothetical protein